MEIQAGLLHGSLASLDQTNATMQQIQNVFGEPSDDGIGAQLSNFWSSWDAVANNPGDPGVRAVLVQQAQTLAGVFNTAASSLQQLRTSDHDAAEVGGRAGQLDLVEPGRAEHSRSRAARSPGSTSARCSTSATSSPNSSRSSPARRSRAARTT